MKNFIMIALLALFVSGCTMTTLPVETAEKRQVPDWYLEHEEFGKEGWIPGFRTRYAYAVAEDVSPSKEMGFRKATLKAKAKLADKVTGLLTNKTTMTYTESGTPQAPLGDINATDEYVNQINAAVLEMYEVEDKMIMYNPELRNYRTFILVKVSEENLNKAR